jgi:hypothetical protein
MAGLRDGVVYCGHAPKLLVANGQAFFDRKLAELCDVGKALNVATYFELDDVIDSADTRFRIVKGLRAAARYSSASPHDKRRPFIDTW